METEAELQYGVICYSEDEYSLRNAKIISVHPSAQEAQSEAEKLQEELGWFETIGGSDLVEYEYYTFEQLFELGKRVVSRIVTVETTEYATENAGRMQFVNTMEAPIEQSS